MRVYFTWKWLSIIIVIYQLFIVFLKSTVHKGVSSVCTWIPTLATSSKLLSANWTADILWLNWIWSFNRQQDCLISDSLVLNFRMIKGRRTILVVNDSQCYVSWIKLDELQGCREILPHIDSSPLLMNSSPYFQMNEGINYSLKYKAMTNSRHQQKLQVKYSNKRRST